MHFVTIRQTAQFYAIFFGKTVKTVEKNARNIRKSY